MITQREPENVHGDVPQRIAHAVNPLGARKAQAKTTADIRVVTQNPRDFIQRGLRNDCVRMHEPEHLGARHRRASVHLPATSAWS